ncbi:MAG TPA: hypothetical protein VMW10_00145 [Alphaproteobacteria bacterium]|nr:hypothetical protein [Alphaproteobacteria bacterium]
MKKDKKTNNTLWDKWTQSPELRNKLFIFVTLIILLILAFFIIWKRYVDRELTHPTSLLQSAPSQQEVELIEEPHLSAQAEIKLFSERLAVLEKKMNQQQQILTTPPKLVALELLRAILEGSIPVETLKTFLQKNPEPWSQELLTTLNPIQQSMTYPQLKALLNQSPGQSLSTWERIKKKIKSIIRIRKLNKKGEYEQGDVEDIIKALKAHDLQKALKSYEKLSPEEKAQLSSWKALAQDRIALELMIKKIILELGNE